MSYQTGGAKKQAFAKVKATDEENAANPLLSSNSARQVKVIEQQLQTIKTKLK